MFGGFNEQQNQIFCFPQMAPNVVSDEMPVQNNHLQTQKRSEVSRRWSGVVTSTLKLDKGVRNKAVGDSAVREYSELAYLEKKSHNDPFIGGR